MSCPARCWLLHGERKNIDTFNNDTVEVEQGLGHHVGQLRGHIDPFSIFGTVGHDTVDIVFDNLGFQTSITVGSDRAVFRDYADRDLGSTIFSVNALSSRESREFPVEQSLGHYAGSASQTSLAHMRIEHPSEAEDVKQV